MLLFPAFLLSFSSILHVLSFLLPFFFFFFTFVSWRVPHIYFCVLTSLMFCLFLFSVMKYGIMTLWTEQNEIVLGSNTRYIVNAKTMLVLLWHIQIINLNIYIHTLSLNVSLVVLKTNEYFDLCYYRVRWRARYVENGFTVANRLPNTCLFTRTYGSTNVNTVIEPLNSLHISISTIEYTQVNNYRWH